jgi:hypothetical protein
MAYQHDPWNNQWDFSGNGDGTLFYPGTPAKIGGTTHIPLASIRLKMVREGMEDYEYLKALSDAGDATLAKQVATTLFPHPYMAEQRAQDLMAARTTIARRLSDLAQPPVAVAPGETPAPAAEEPPPAADPLPGQDPLPGEDLLPASDPLAGGSDPSSPPPEYGVDSPLPGESSTPPVLADGSPVSPDLDADAVVQAGGCSAPGTAGLAALLGLLAALRRINRKR